MHAYLQPIHSAFQKNANAENAAGMKAYLLDQFEFFGIKTPGRRPLGKTHYKEYPIKDLKELETIVWECFELPEREFQYFGIELFAFHKKAWNSGSIKLMEKIILTKSWWDSVDHINAELLGPYFLRFPEKTAAITGKWNKSENIWLQRSSILFQKAYKEKTDTELLSRYILHCAGSKEFFIRKVIGWMLREYGRTDPAWVKKFVKQHSAILSPLSQREALKNLK